MKKYTFLVLFSLIGQISIFAQHTLPTLPYAYEALEPYIDKQTMEIHHSKHHQAYVNNLNKALEGQTYANEKLEDLLLWISQYPTAIRNNAGGHWNHSFFWQIMAPKDKAGKPSEKLLKMINESFGSYDAFKTQFAEAANKRFGSGWAWLIVKDKKMVITSTANQDNPLMDVAEVKGTPILTLDVWEHAYYLKYQNKRADYTNAFFEVINWNEVNKRFEEAIKK